MLVRELISDSDWLSSKDRGFDKRCIRPLLKSVEKLILKK